VTVSLLSALYREAHFQMMKRNPGISEETLLKRIRKFSVKKSFFTLFSVFLFLGILVAVAYRDSNSLRLSLAIFLFLSSVFMTSMSIQQAAAAKIFEPLVTYPVPKIERKIPILFIIDSLTILGLAIPSATLAAFQDLSGTFAYILWLIFAILFGHTVGMGFLAIFGVKKSRSHKSSSNLLFGFFAILLVLVMVPGFLASAFAEISFALFEKFWFIYPFTVLCDAQKSLILLLIYSAFLLPAGLYISERGVRAIMEPKLEMGSKVSFHPFFGGKTSALVLKDLKLVSRNPSGLVGMIIPFLITAPQVAIVSSLSGGDSVIVQSLATVSLFSPIILGLLTRGEGKEIDFLKTLPVSRRDFMLGKVFASGLIVCFSSSALILIAIAFGASPLALLPAISLPLAISMFSAIFLFDYQTDEVGIPEMGLRRMAVLLTLCAIFTSLLISPMSILPVPACYATTFAFSAAAFALMFRKVRN